MVGLVVKLIYKVMEMIFEEIWFIRYMFMFLFCFVGEVLLRCYIVLGEGFFGEIE